MPTLIRIDPFTQLVDEVEYDRDWKQLASDADALIRAPDGSGSGLMQIVSHGKHDLIMDDEGLFQEGWPSFTTQLWPHGSLTGRVLVACSDSEGRTIAPTLTRDEIARMVTWDQPAQVPSFEVITGDEALRAMGLL